MKQRKLLSQRHPILYFISVWEKRIRRQITWIIDRKKYAQKIDKEKLPFRVKKHQSKLLKKLGDTDMQLQYNKVDNFENSCSKNKRINNQAWRNILVLQNSWKTYKKERV